MVRSFELGILFTPESEAIAAGRPGDAAAWRLRRGPVSAAGGESVFCRFGCSDLRAVVGAWRASRRAAALDDAVL